MYLHVCISYVRTYVCACVCVCVCVCVCDCLVGTLTDMHACSQLVQDGVHGVFERRIFNGRSARTIFRLLNVKVM